MTVLGWLKEWRRANPPKRKSAPVAPRRPRLEALEDRLAPAVLTVTLVGDTGFGSLRERIGTANPGDIINFSTALNNQTITLLSALTINKNLTITASRVSKDTPISSGEVHPRQDKADESPPVSLETLDAVMARIRMVIR